VWTDVVGVDVVEDQARAVLLQNLQDALHRLNRLSAMLVQEEEGEHTIVMGELNRLSAIRALAEEEEDEAIVDTDMVVSDGESDWDVFAIAEAVVDIVAHIEVVADALLVQ